MGIKGKELVLGALTVGALCALASSSNNENSSWPSLGYLPGYITIGIRLKDGGTNEQLEGICRGLCFANFAEMADAAFGEQYDADYNKGKPTGPRFPDIYKSGVKYRQEPIGQELWLTASQLLSRGYGDCEDLACYRVAWLWQNGVKAAQPCVARFVLPLVNKQGKKIGVADLRHGFVWNGSEFEDPSARLGMPSGTPEYQAMWARAQAQVRPRLRTMPAGPERTVIL